MRTVAESERAGDWGFFGSVGFIYTLLALPGTFVVSHVFNWLSFISSIPRPEAAVLSFVLWALPSVLAGAVVVGVLAYVTQRRGVRGASGRWLVRCAPFLFAIVALAFAIFPESFNDDFWLFGELIVWPWIALIAGAIVEPLAAHLGRQQNLSSPRRRGPPRLECDV